MHQDHISAIAKDEKTKTKTKREREREIETGQVDQSRAFLTSTKGITIGEIDENMMIAQRVDAINTQRFHFHGQKLTCNEIVNGPSGLVDIINNYLEGTGKDNICNGLSANDRDRINTYLEFTSKRAAGAIPTVSKRIRSFIREHPKYGRDSIIGDEVGTDLINYLHQWIPLGP
jgi:hypothetical protein